MRRRSWLTLVTGTLCLFLLVRFLAWGLTGSPADVRRTPGQHNNNNNNDGNNNNNNGDDVTRVGRTDGAAETDVDSDRFLPNGEINWDVWGFARNVSIVYTWVNGSDPAYRVIRAQHGGTKAVGGSRDRDSGELMHSLRSVERYMSWHRGMIYIVAPNQIPSWIKRDHPRVRFIDQDSLFSDPSVLPVFSSNPVEQNLWKIPGLSSRFIHMNDDYFLGKPVMPWHFFTKEGGVRLFFESSIVRGARKEHDEMFQAKKKLWLASVYNSIALFEEEYGHRTRNFVKHAPFAYHRDALKRIQEKWKPQFDETLQHKFRHWNDVLVPFTHHNYLIEEGATCCGFTYEIAPPNEMQFDASFVLIKDDEGDVKAKFQNVRTYRPRFFAMNDSFSKSSTAKLLFDFLEELYPFPSSFEVV